MKSSYRSVKCRVFLGSFLILIGIWLLYFFSLPLTSEQRLTTDGVQKYLLSQRLHLIDQRIRPEKIIEIIQTVRRVKASKRLEIFQGHEIRLWFYRLMVAERAQIMESILPQPFMQSMKFFLKWPRQKQEEMIWDVLEELYQSGRLSQVLTSLGLQDEIPSRDDLRRDFFNFWEAQSSKKLYNFILERMFDKISSKRTSLSPLEKAQLIIFELVSTGIQQDAWREERSF